MNVMSVSNEWKEKWKHIEKMETYRDWMWSGEAEGAYCVCGESPYLTSVVPLGNVGVYASLTSVVPWSNLGVYAFLTSVVPYGNTGVYAYLTSEVSKGNMGVSAFCV